MGQIQDHKKQRRMKKLNGKFNHTVVIDKTSLSELEDSAFMSRKYPRRRLTISQKWKSNLPHVVGRKAQANERQASADPPIMLAAHRTGCHYNDHP